MGITGHELATKDRSQLIVSLYRRVCWTPHADTSHLYRVNLNLKHVLAVSQIYHHDLTPNDSKMMIEGQEKGIWNF
jgi:hypothetical protein